MLNVFQTMSWDWKPDGAINKMQIQTPNTQTRLMSSEDRRFTILKINGILKNGIIMAQISEMISKTLILPFQNLDR